MSGGGDEPKREIIRLSDKLKGDNWNSRFVRGRELLTPIECLHTSNCQTCYVVLDYGGDKSYCGNPSLLSLFQEHGTNYDNLYHYRYEAQWQIILRLREETKVAAKVSVEGDRLVIPKGVQFKCKSCSHTWTARTSRKPKVSTGVRCPTCHARNIVHATDNSPILEKGPGMRGMKVKVQKDKERKEKQGAIDSSGISVTRPRLTTDRKERIRKIRESFREGEGPPRQVKPELEEVERLPTEAEDIDAEITRLLPEIFDEETFMELHKAEVDFVSSMMGRTRPGEELDPLLANMSKKLTTLLRLVFRHPDIDTLLKVTLVLYGVNQATLLGRIRSQPRLVQYYEETQEEGGEEGSA